MSLIPNRPPSAMDRWVIGAEKHTIGGNLKVTFIDSGIRSWWNRKEYGFVHPLDDATRYYSKEEAEAAALMAVTNNPSYIGHLWVYEESEAIAINKKELEEWRKLQADIRSKLLMEQRLRGSS